jgi:hypothetical protein
MCVSVFGSVVCAQGGAADKQQEMMLETVRVELVTRVFVLAFCNHVNVCVFSHCNLCLQIAVCLLCCAKGRGERKLLRAFTFVQKG